MISYFVTKQDNNFIIHNKCNNFICLCIFISGNFDDDMHCYKHD
jgi:lipid-A-disaccharide synthase-like uncharacterized protein